MSYLLELLRLLQDNAGTPTHPDGCVAVVGADVKPGKVKWVALTSTCGHIHPATVRGLRQQYRLQGWTNLDEEKQC